MLVTKSDEFACSILALRNCAAEQPQLTERSPRPPWFGSHTELCQPRAAGGESVHACGDVLLPRCCYRLSDRDRPYRLKNAASIGSLEHTIATVEVKKDNTYSKHAALPEARCPKVGRRLRAISTPICAQSSRQKNEQALLSVAALAGGLCNATCTKTYEGLPGRSQVVWATPAVNRVVVGSPVTAVAAVVAAVAFLVMRPLRQARHSSASSAGAGKGPATDHSRAPSERLLSREMDISERFSGLPVTKISMRGPRRSYESLPEPTEGSFSDSAIRRSEPVDFSPSVH